MNLNTLETIARQISKTGKSVRDGDVMLSPAEHKSISSLSWQIAANIRANGAPSTTAAIRIHPLGGWM